MLFGPSSAGVLTATLAPPALGGAARQGSRRSAWRSVRAVGVLRARLRGGLFLAVGIAALLALVALGSVAIVASSVVKDRQVE